MFKFVAFALGLLMKAFTDIVSQPKVNVYRARS